MEKLILKKEKYSSKAKNISGRNLLRCIFTDSTYSVGLYPKSGEVMTSMENQKSVTEEREHTAGGKRCPVCGKGIVGRADKIYCSMECRVYANNEKKRGQRGAVSNTLAPGMVADIGEELNVMYNGGGKGYVKLISLVTRFCKILYKFGR